MLRVVAVRRCGPWCATCHFGPLTFGTLTPTQLLGHARPQQYDFAMETERTHLHMVEAGERLPVPADDLEFLDDSASVNAEGLRQELHELPSD